MRRGDLYRVFKGSRTDPKRHRVFVVVSRQVLVDTKFSTVICAPVYASSQGLSTQVPVGIQEGLKHGSAIFCDQLVSIRKTKLTNYVGTLPEGKMLHLDRALRIALALE